MIDEPRAYVVVDSVALGEGVVRLALSARGETLVADTEVDPAGWARRDPHGHVTGRLVVAPTSKTRTRSPDTEPGIRPAGPDGDYVVDGTFHTPAGVPEVTLPTGTLAVTKIRGMRLGPVEVDARLLFVVDSLRPAAIHWRPGAVDLFHDGCLYQVPAVHDGDEPTAYPWLMTQHGGRPGESGLDELAAAFGRALASAGWRFAVAREGTPLPDYARHPRPARDWPTEHVLERIVRGDGAYTWVTLATNGIRLTVRVDGDERATAALVGRPVQGRLEFDSRGTVLRARRPDTIRSLGEGRYVVTALLDVHAWNVYHLEVNGWKMAASFGRELVQRVESGGYFRLYLDRT